MGKALLRALLPSVGKPESPISRISVAVRNKPSSERLSAEFGHSTALVDFTSNGNVKVAENADAVFLGFPPYLVNDVLGSPGMQRVLERKLIISILAGIPTSQIKDTFHDAGIGGERTGDKTACVIRAMPNIGALIHEAASLIAIPHDPAEKEWLDFTSWIFHHAGKVYTIPDSVFEAATGASAVSYALTTVAIDTIVNQCVAEGIPRPMALSIASQCVRGSCSLISTGMDPAHLRKSLTAPGSITGQAISHLEQRNLHPLLANTVSMAVQKAKTMGSQQHTTDS